MGTRLVVSLAGLSGRDLDGCMRFAAELDRREVPLSLLVAPRPRGVEHPVPDSPVLRWVRERTAGGDAVALHGFDHSAGVGKGLVPRIVSAAGRPSRALRGAEFAALPTHEAGLRLLAALAVVDQLGLRVDAFVPPRWFASPGTLTALRRAGFAVCADAVAVRELQTGKVHRARVYGLGPIGRAEPWWCRAMVLGVARTARRGGAVRLALDAADLDRPGPRQAALDAVDLALHHGARPTTYGDYGGATRCGEASAPVSTAGIEPRRRNLDPLSS